MTRIFSIFIGIIIIECCLLPTSTHHNVVIAFQLSLSAAAGNNVVRPSFFRNNNNINKPCDTSTVNERTNTILSYSQTTDLDPAIRTSFEDRMRRIALTEQRKSSSTHDNSQTTIDLPHRIKPDHIIDVTSISNFYDIVMGKDGKQQNKISVVRWYATWCRSCRAVEPYFYGLQSKLGNVNKVQYIDVAATKDGILHAGFNIPKVPYGHIYHPTFGLVEELRLTPKRIKDFELILRSYIDGYCELSDSIYKESGIYGPQYQRSS